MFTYAPNRKRGYETIFAANETVGKSETISGNRKRGYRGHHCFGGYRRYLVVR